MRKKNTDTEFLTVKKGPLVIKNDSGAIRMSIITVDGRPMYDFRQFYRPRGSNDWLPTGKGFTVPLNLGLKATSLFKKFAKETADYSVDDEPDSITKPVAKKKIKSFTKDGVPVQDAKDWRAENPLPKKKVEAAAIKRKVKRPNI